MKPVPCAGKCTSSQLTIGGLVTEKRFVAQSCVWRQQNDNRSNEQANWPSEPAVPRPAPLAWRTPLFVPWGFLVLPKRPAAVDGLPVEEDIEKMFNFNNPPKGNSCYLLRNNRCENLIYYNATWTFAATTTMLISILGILLQFNSLSLV